MRKLISTLGIITIITGTAIISCQSTGTRSELVENKPFSQENDLNAVNAANLEAMQTERTIFLNMTGVKIKYNDDRIAELREKKNSANVLSNTAYWQAIDSLETANREMKVARIAYEQSQNDAAAFQRKFSSGLDALTQSLKASRQ